MGPTWQPRRYGRMVDQWQGHSAPCMPWIMRVSSYPFRSCVETCIPAIDLFKVFASRRKQQDKKAWATTTTTTEFYCIRNVIERWKNIHLRAVGTTNNPVEHLSTKHLEAPNIPEAKVSTWRRNTRNVLF